MRGDRGRAIQEKPVGLEPALDPETYVFCAANDPQTVAKAEGLALCVFKEPEATSLILMRAAAERLGFDVSLPMRRITLMLNSALDGVGLTAAVSAALATENIACNVVAAYRHDHLFVPARAAEPALRILKRLRWEEPAPGAGPS